MKKALFVIALLVAAILFSYVQSTKKESGGSNFDPSALKVAKDVTAAEPVSVRLDPSTAHQLTVKEASPGIYDITTTSGGDPHIASINLKEAFDPSKLTVFSFEYFCPSGIDGLTVFFGPPINGTRTVSTGALPKAETWVESSINMAAKSRGNWKGKINAFRIDPGTKAGVRLQLRNIQLRAPTAKELKGAKELQAERDAKIRRATKLAKYLGTTFPATIDDVTVLGHEIQIAGSLPASDSNLLLAEIRMHEEPWALENFSRTTSLGEADGGSIAHRIPRFDGPYDRLFSRWAVVRRESDGSHALASHAVFPTDLSALTPKDLPRPRTQGKKGMGAIEHDDIATELVELGVEHVTVNISLHTLVSLKPLQGAIPHQFEGATYYIQRPDLEEDYDRKIKFATDHGMTVSIIILTGFPQDRALRDVFLHPESSSPGAYGMPNLTQPEGVRIYAAALDFLAQRYASASGPHGLVSNWIMHNEVDYAWTWSNMGEQPMALFMDTHMRSMRMAYLLARKYHPHARVFLSLTHSWHKEGPQGRSYAPRTMVDRLAEYSRTEGDFEWGLAYHPYPQSLFKADAWNDEMVKFSFDTPMITPKNIEVLDAYLKQPSMLYQGKTLRGVLLSEQGYHSDGYSEKAQQIQAAAFVYTWHKIRPLKSIEAFHNHRWIDHPDEGGLMLGLRTFPDKNHPHGEKKLSWGIFKALDTPQEAAASQFAKEIIGVKDFSEIPHQGEIE